MYFMRVSVHSKLSQYEKFSCYWNIFNHDSSLFMIFYCKLIELYFYRMTLQQASLLLWFPYNFVNFRNGWHNEKKIGHYSHAIVAK